MPSSRVGNICKEMPTSQVVKELALELRSHNFALSFNENGKSLNQMVSLETPFILWCHTSLNITRYLYLGSAMDILQIALVGKE